MRDDSANASRGIDVASELKGNPDVVAVIDIRAPEGQENERAKQRNERMNRVIRGADIPMLAERLGLPHTPLQAVLTLQHKYYAREAFGRIAPEANARTALIRRDFERVSPAIVSRASAFAASILADVAGRRGTLDGRMNLDLALMLAPAVAHDQTAAAPDAAPGAMALVQ